MTSPIALLSVSDKTGLVEFAHALHIEFGFEFISSGGTATALLNVGLPVIKVADYTGSPEILGGRVKTLHPRIHGGILARKDIPQDQVDLEQHHIRSFDLVVVNLYPFEETVAHSSSTLNDIIEQIDIGGPAMVRAAAKNFAHLTVLCHPQQYTDYLKELRQWGTASLDFRQHCALTAFRHTAAYDSAISGYLETFSRETASYTLTGHPQQVLRYGENPHQSAVWYHTGTQASGWSAATQLQGKELSYNNLLDLDAARSLMAEFTVDAEPAVAILKHTNPCGVALGESLIDAYQKAFHADSISAFGGIVALNQSIDIPTANALINTFLECVVAPDCTLEARQILQSKPNLRVLLLPEFTHKLEHQVKAIAGGFLVQSTDQIPEDQSQWQIVTEIKPTVRQMKELRFAWRVCKKVKSNAIVISQDLTTIGIGAGQMNRVASVKIALEQAGDKGNGGVLASDGFFPFDDSVRVAATHGIKAIIQPGGSLRDKDSILAANELGITMILTGVRHFLH